MSAERRPRLPAAVEAKLKGRGTVTFDITVTERPRIESFCRAVQAGEVPSELELRFIALALEKILAGVTANTAFRLAPGRGRKQDQRTQIRDQRIRYEVEALKEHWGQGSLKNKVIPIVAQRWSVSEDTVTRIWKRYRASQNRMQKLERGN